jgi:tRNA(Ile)-lysidine synthase
MEGEKKVSDFLVDSKTPRDRKRHVLVLVAGEEIAWVCGMRLDDRFKVTDDTKNVLRVEMKILPANQGG